MMGAMNTAESKRLTPPRREDVQASLDACLANAERLMDDAQWLEAQKQGGTCLAISMLAQEEYAKAFTLYLVREELVPWDSDLLRVIRNHACKHLIAIVMEYIDPEWETLEQLQEIIRAEYALEGRFPKRVSSALNILYHEKIRRGDFAYGEEYHPDAEGIARGKRDQVKQNAVYIDLDKSCRVRNSPLGITQEQAQREYELARRYGSIIRGLLRAEAYEGVQLQKLKEVMKIVFWQQYK